MLYRVGAYAEALEHHQRALEIQQRGGSPDREVAMTMRSVALVRHALGEAEAFTLAREALDLGEQPVVLVATLFFGVIAWFTLAQNLKPLKAITETAEQINRADDLSRRIPYSGPDNNEIGNLVGSFNQTLERLDALFTSQQRLLADVSHELRTPLTVIKGKCRPDAAYEGA